MSSKPNDALVLNQRAAEFASAQKFSEAIRILEEALARYPEFPSTFHNLGAVHMLRRDMDAAEKCFVRVLKLDPSCAKAHFNLANIYREQGAIEKSVHHLEAVLSLEPKHHSAAHILAATKGTTPERAPLDFVKKLFDQYAPSFDSALKELNYRAPSLLLSVLGDRFKSGIRFHNVLDLGCGTGLSGVQLADYCNTLVGVDISEKMLEQAKSRGIYQGVVKDDILHFLCSTETRFDLFIAGDVFNYFGNLEPLFAGVKRCSSPSIHLAFTVESYGKDGYHLAYTGRFQHSQNYVLNVAEDNGFKIVKYATEVIRNEKTGPVEGTVFLFIRDLT